jgi:hypothetical protein
MKNVSVIILAVFLGNLTGNLFYEVCIRSAPNWDRFTHASAMQGFSVLGLWVALLWWKKKVGSLDDASALLPGKE